MNADRIDMAIIQGREITGDLIPDLIAKLRSPVFIQLRGINIYLNAAANEIERLQARVAELEKGLAHAIKDADGWCDDARGCPSPELGSVRKLLSPKSVGNSVDNPPAL